MANGLCKRITCWWVYCLEPTKRDSFYRHVLFRRKKKYGAAFILLSFIKCVCFYNLHLGESTYLFIYCTFFVWCEIPNPNGETESYLMKPIRRSQDEQTISAHIVHSSCCWNLQTRARETSVCARQAPDQYGLKKHNEANYPQQHYQWIPSQDWQLWNTAPSHDPPSTPPCTDCYERTLLYAPRLLCGTVCHLSSIAGVLL